MNEQSVAARSLYLLGDSEEDTTGIARRVARISVSAIKQMPVLASSIDGCVSLGQGIPSFRTPEFIREAVREALMDDDAIGKYSLQPGMLELRAEIARQLQRGKGLDQIDPDTEIVITCGAMEGLAAAISSVVDHDDEVILLSPCYSSHIEQVLFAEGQPVFVPLIEDDGWRLDVDRLRAALTARTKAIIISSPANPTGAVFDEQTLRGVAQVAIDHGIYVIADETYDFLVYDNGRHFSLASIPELRQLLIATYSFSKAYSMTGWRVGYLYASKTIVDQVLKVHDAFAICAPTISQFAALVALRHTNGRDAAGDRAIRETTAHLATRRDLICRLLDGLDGLFRYQKPQGAYYVFSSIVPPNMTSMELALRLLREAKVITIPGNGFGPTGEGHIRFSFGGTEETIVEAMARIESWAVKVGHA